MTEDQAELQRRELLACCLLALSDPAGTWVETAQLSQLAWLVDSLQGERRYDFVEAGHGMGIVWSDLAAALDAGQWRTNGDAWQSCLPAAAAAHYRDQPDYRLAQWFASWFPLADRTRRETYRVVWARFRHPLQTQTAHDFEVERLAREDRCRLAGSQAARVAHYAVIVAGVCARIAMARALLAGPEAAREAA